MLEKQEDILQSLDKNKREIDVEMLVQCRLNSTHFEGLRDKKRMAQQMQSHMQAMLQEYKLMEKQLEEKAKAAKIFQKRAETVKELNSIKQQRKNALKSHREQQTEMNHKQVADGRFRKEQSMEAKDNLQRMIWREKHKQYLEVRNRELEDVKRAMGDLGSEVNQKVIRARYSKIDLQEGRISQRKYIKGKLESLDRDLVSRIDSKTQDIEQIWSSMQMIQQKQKQLNEHLKHVDSAFHESQKELAKVTKLTQTEVKILKKPTLTKDFNDFADKVRKAESLYRAESRKNSEYQTETASVQKGARQFYHTATLFVDEKTRKPTASLSVRSPSLGDLGAAKRNPLAKSGLTEKGKISQSVLFKGPQTSR